MQQAVGLAAPPDRHDQRVGDELGRHLGFHRPADDTAGEQVDDGGHVEPSLGGPDVGEVGDPLLVRRRCLELRGPGGCRHGWRRSPVSFGSAGVAAEPAALLAHQPLDAVQAARPDPRPARRARHDGRHRCGRCLEAADRSGRRAPRRSASRRWALRLSQAWKPDRETPSASHIHATGQIPRCFAMKANLISSPSRSRPRLFLGCRAPPSASPLPCAAGRSPAAPASSDHGRERHAPDRKPNSLTHLRSTFSCRSRSRAACATATPRSFTSLTASSLNSRLNFRLSIPTSSSKNT
jgi:hypothetical protein